ncbi:MAG: hypothetical protein AAGI09_01295 [Pseudomonadota bacterium]
MDRFIFNTDAFERIEEIPGESQFDPDALAMPRVLGVWGSDGASLQSPDLAGMHIGPAIPGTAEPTLDMSADSLF